MTGGLFLGLETSVRGLMAQQTAIDTVSHNIDNANTPGYSRQTVNLTESIALDDGYGPGRGYVGTGVQVENISRDRDSFLDAQYRQQNSMLGQANVDQTTLNQITADINEPSTTGISASLQNYWNAWDTLGSNPDQLSARTEVVQTGTTLADTLNQTASQLSDLHTDLANNLSARVGQVNSWLGQVGQLNQQIANAQSTGSNPNDLMDQRDEILDQISQYANVSTSTDPTTGNFQVSIGGQTVVDGNSFKQLQGDAAAGTISVSTDSFTSSPATIPAGETWTALSSVGGELQGNLDGLTTTETYQKYIGQLTQTMADQVNGYETTGYSQTGPGQNFFNYSLNSDGTLNNISVVVSASQVAAGTQTTTDSSGNTIALSGDGTLATQIAGLTNQNLTFPEDPSDPSQPLNGTIDNYMQAVVGELGIQGQQANNDVTNQTSLVNQIDTQRQSVSGVSIDEEMTNMIQYQQAYNASAKMISTINDMLTALMQNV